MMEQVFCPYPSENTVVPARPGRQTLEPKRDRTHQPEGAFDLVPRFQQPLPGTTLPQSQQLQAARLLATADAILSQRRIQFPPRGLCYAMQLHTVVHTIRNHTRHRPRYFGQQDSGDRGLRFVHGSHYVRQNRVSPVDYRMHLIALTEPARRSTAPCIRVFATTTHRQGASIEGGIATHSTQMIDAPLVQCVRSLLQFGTMPATRHRTRVRQTGRTQVFRPVLRLARLHHRPILERRPQHYSENIPVVVATMPRSSFDKRQQFLYHAPHLAFHGLPP